jgi:hypothetical protein
MILFKRKLVINEIAKYFGERFVSVHRVGSTLIWTIREENGFGFTAFAFNFIFGDMFWMSMSYNVHGKYYKKVRSFKMFKEALSDWDKKIGRFKF